MRQQYEGSGTSIIERGTGANWKSRFLHFHRLFLRQKVRIVFRLAGKLNSNFPNWITFSPGRVSFYPRARVFTLIAAPRNAIFCSNTSAISAQYLVFARVSQPPYGFSSSSLPALTLLLCVCVWSSGKHSAFSNSRILLVSRATK